MFSVVVPPKLLDRLGGLRQSLAKASIRIGFKAYTGMMAFTTVIAAGSVFLVSYLLSISFRIRFIQPLFLSSIFGVLAAGLSLILFFSYPVLVAYSRGRNVDANLPIIANFLSVLASSGMPPESIFRSLAKVGKEFKVTEETKSIVRDMELMGLDLHTTLMAASERSPSKKFSSLLSGIIATSRSGGDLASYLSEQADKYKRERMQDLKNFVENLAVVAEVYVTLMIAAPLMLIVMLSVMSFIGGGVQLVGVDPRILLDILTFIIVPVGVTLLILVVDAATPPR